MLSFNEMLVVKEKEREGAFCDCPTLEGGGYDCALEQLLLRFAPGALIRIFFLAKSCCGGRESRQKKVVDW
jgi:hypothetical protein